jgi:hypothetical protein
MGWGDCGLDSQGRPIGYVHSATCDHPDCNEKIDRGLSYACGGMHGQNEYGCEKYFCEDHLQNAVFEYGEYHNICDQCAQEMLDSGEWYFCESDGVLKRDWSEAESQGAFAEFED